MLESANRVHFSESFKAPGDGHLACFNEEGILLIKIYIYIAASEAFISEEIFGEIFI